MPYWLNAGFANGNLIKKITQEVKYIYLRFLILLVQYLIKININLES